MHLKSFTTKLSGLVGVIYYVSVGVTSTKHLHKVTGVALIELLLTNLSNFTGEGITHMFFSLN